MRECKCRCANRPSLHPDFSEQLRRANETLWSLVQQQLRPNGGRVEEGGADFSESPLAAARNQAAETAEKVSQTNVQLAAINRSIDDMATRLGAAVTESLGKRGRA